MIKQKLTYINSEAYFVGSDLYFLRLKSRFVNHSIMQYGAWLFYWSLYKLRYGAKYM